MSPIRYNPGFRGDEDLIRTFVVRKQDLELILETISEANGPSNGHLLIVGPRGIGKTTLVRRVAAEVRTHPTLQKQWYPIVFSEESYDVGSAGEFWLVALFHLADQTQDLRWLNAYRDLKQERDEVRLRDRSLAQLLDFADEQGKRLLLIVENLNMLLGDQLTEQDAWDLRHTLHNEPRLMLIGTATMRFEEIEHADKAWFELLTIHDLKPLDNTECKILWKHLTQNELIDARVRPIQILTGGNPRLISILADFAVKTSFQELMNNLIQLIDDHTEYFKSQLDRLASIERKVFVALLDLWDPVSASDVAKSARLDVSKTSALLGRLVNRGAVTEKKLNRKKLYQAAERLYNIYYLMRRRGHPSDRVHAVVTFMIQFYEGDQLVSTTAKLAEEACRLKPEQRIDHFYAYENIMKLTSESYRSEIVKATPTEFFRTLDAPIDLRRYASITDGDLKEELVSSVEPEDATQWVNRGDVLLSKTSEVDKAKIAYKTAIKLNANLPGAWLGLGKVYNQLKQYVKAEEAYRKAIELEPTMVSAWDCLGDLLHISMNRYEEAAQVFRKALDLEPSDGLAWGLLGHIYSVHLQRSEDAETAFRKALDLNLKESWVWGQYGKLIHMKGDFDEAEKAFRNAVEIDPQDAWSWAELGQLLYAHFDKFEEGAVALNKAVEINPKDTWALGNLAKAYECMGRYEDAEQTIRAALELDSNTSEAWADLAHLLHEVLDRLPEAEEVYKKIIQIEPQSAWAWAHLGKLYKQLERYESAEQSLQKAIAIDSNSSWIWIEFGSFYEHMHKYDMAEQSYKRASELDPESDLAWLSLIKLGLISRDSLGLARAYAQRYLQQKGSTPDQLNNVAWAFYESGFADLLSEAEAWACEAIKKSPNYWEGAHTLACILGTQGKWNQALDIASIFINAAGTEKEAIRPTTDFLISAAAAGFTKESLMLVESSEASTALEPLIVGLRIVLGNVKHTAQEIFEIGKDVAQRIYALKGSIDL